MSTTARLGELLLGEMRFGMRDAFAEAESSPESLAFFMESFVAPQGIAVDKYVSGEKFFIKGRKGTGKTALLHYIAQKLLADKSVAYRIVLFSRIPEIEKSKMMQVTNSKLISGTRFREQPRLANYAEPDISLAWTIYLHRELAGLLAGHRDLVEPSNALTKYLQKTSEFFDGPSESLLARFFSRLKGGKIVISKLGAFSFWLGPRVVLEEPLTVAARELDELFAKITLKPGTRLVLLIDEINPDSINSQARENDVVLIRNLVNAVHDFNIRWRKQRGNAISVICAVRSEVMSLVDPTGSETHRALRSFGDEITWRRKNRDDKFYEAPIIRLVANKIKHVEKRKYGHFRTPEQIWSTYFANQIYHLEPQRYIYESTWARPRDLILLLQTAAERSHNAHKFHEKVFERVQTDTQREFWSARVEELLLYYSEQEIAALQRCLTGFQRDFTITDFQKRVNGIAKDDTEVKKLIKQYEPLPILMNLYKAGILGNRDNKGNVFWEHEFDANANTNNSFIVHRGLYNHLRVLF